MRPRAIARAALATFAAALLAGCGDPSGPVPLASTYALLSPYQLGTVRVVADTLRFGVGAAGERMLDRTRVVRVPRAGAAPGEPTETEQVTRESMAYSFTGGRVYADRPCMSVAPPAGATGAAVVFARCTKSGPDVDGYRWGRMLRVRSFGLSEYHLYAPVP